jgi:hypothetical protein
MNTRHVTPLRSLVVALLAVLLIGGAAPTAAAPIMPDVVANTYFDEVLGDMNLDRAAEIVHLNARLHTPEGAFMGGDGVAEFVGGLRASFDGLEFDVRATDFTAESAIVEFSLTGTHTGMYRDAVPDCARIAVDGVAVLKVDAAGITEAWITYDQQTILDQIYVHSLGDENARPACDL